MIIHGGRAALEASWLNSDLQRNAEALAKVIQDRMIEIAVSAGDA
jgi:hypothetical protein